MLLGPMLKSHVIFRAVHGPSRPTTSILHPFLLRIICELCQPLPYPLSFFLFPNGGVLTAPDPISAVNRVGNAGWVVQYLRFSYTTALPESRLQVKRVVQTATEDGLSPFIFSNISYNIFGQMMQSTRFYIFALAAVIFFTILLLLAQTLPNEPRPDTIKPVRWSAQQSMGQNLDSDRKAEKGIDWSRFAYVQYVTKLPYLCNSLMLFESLYHLGCKPDRLMMYPSTFSLDSDKTESRLLTKARDEYNVKLKPIDIQRRTDTHDRKLPKDANLQGTKIRHSNLGRELHKASRLQSDRVSAGPSSRLRLYSTSVHG